MLLIAAVVVVVLGMIGVMRMRRVMRVMMLFITFVATGLALVLDVHVHETELSRQCRAVAMIDHFKQALRRVCFFEGLGKLFGRRVPQMGVPTDGFQ